MEPIIKEVEGVKQKVRILRPSEAKLLIQHIPKFDYQGIFKALLYSVMRYAECQRLQKNPQWFDASFIHM